MDDLAELRDQISGIIRKFPDFPTKGIIFCDIMPLMKHPKVLNQLCLALANHYRGKVDVVAGLEARGFLFGPQIAQLLEVPFVPIRKQGKLPGPTISASYQKEYGLDVVEIQSDALDPNSRVLIVDDLLATGGTLKAAIDLIKQAGAQVYESFVLFELEFLKGREVLGDSPVNSLIKMTDT